MTTRKANQQPPAAYEPAAWDLPDASALQALARGEASPEQQQRALNWIVYAACGTYDADYRPDPREHAAVSGKRLVGLQIVKLLKVNVGAMSAKTKRQQQQE